MKNLFSVENLNLYKYLRDCSDFSESQNKTLGECVRRDLGTNAPSLAQCEHWLRGLPSVLAIEFMDGKIEELGYDKNAYWGDLAFVLYSFFVEYFTRCDYMAGYCSHQKYYSQFVTMATMGQVSSALGAKIVESKDFHFNDIPMRTFDALSATNTMNTQVFKLCEAASYSSETMGKLLWSPNCNTCILKNAAHQIRKEKAPHTAHSVRVFYYSDFPVHANRGHFDTIINGNLSTIQEYYTGQFNIGDGQGGDKIVTIQRVELI